MSVNNTLAERGSRYGRFADHAQIAQGIQDVMRNTQSWDHLDPDMKQALTVIADKIARILNGDPYYVDNWHDIQGYAKLIEDRIEMIPEPVQELYEVDLSDVEMIAANEPPSISEYETHGVIREPQYEATFRENTAILTGGPGFNGA